MERSEALVLTVGANAVEVEGQLAGGELECPCCGGVLVELHAGTGLGPVWRGISELSPDGYQFSSMQDGPDRWRMQVTRRQPAS